jgi:hypothetical protein
MFAMFVLLRASYVIVVTLTVHVAISLPAKFKLLAFDKFLGNLIDSFALI